MKIIAIPNPEDRDALERFSRLAEEVYRDDPIWVPQSEDYFRQAYAAARLGGAGFLPVMCLDDDRPVARAVAIYNPRSSLASIGFFEHLPGAQAAGQAVLAYCEEHLARQGAGMVEAPRVDNLWMGLLVKGYDLPQAVFTPHNPPEYHQTFQRSGYHEVERLVTYCFTRTSVKIPTLQVPGIHTRPFDHSRLENEIHILNFLQGRIFADHAGYVPRTLAEDRAMLSAFLPLLDDDLVIIAEDTQNRPVGLLICLPDLYQAYKGRPVDSARLISIGVLPGWKYKGSGVLMVNHLVRNLLEKGYQLLEASWIKAGNALPQNLALRFGGQARREFVLFGKQLAPIK